MTELNFNNNDYITIWANVLTSAWEKYSWWKQHDYLDGLDWMKPGRVVIKLDYDNVNITRTINQEDLVKAYEELLKQGYRIDVSNINSYDGDAIMQQAVLGEVAFG